MKTRDDDDNNNNNRSFVRSSNVGGRGWATGGDRAGKWKIPEPEKPILYTVCTDDNIESITRFEDGKNKKKKTHFSLSRRSLRSLFQRVNSLNSRVPSYIVLRGIQYCYLCVGDFLFMFDFADAADTAKTNSVPRRIDIV